MKAPSILVLLLFLLGVPATGLHAQRTLEKKKVAKTTRPNDLKVRAADVSDYYFQNFDQRIDFAQIKIVKSELAFYLLGSEQNGPIIFAFELQKKRKWLRLISTLPVQTCDQGDLSLRTFLEVDGKLSGCRLGAHTIRQKQYN